MLISQCNFDEPALELMGPLLGPLKPTAYGPRGHCIALPPPLSAPLSMLQQIKNK